MTKYLTKQGLENLKKELKQLETVDRKEVIKRIAHAASHGDLKENAGYHAAREDQGFIESRIKSLKASIDQAEIIEPSKGGEVRIASSVILKSKDGKEKFQLVEPEEANIAEGRISIKSLLGEALLGKKKGDLVSFNTPGGPREYKIEEVE